MKKHYLILAVFLLLCSLFSNTWSQNGFFQKIDESAIINSSGIKEIKPQKSSTSTADIAGLKAFLWSLPDEKNVSNRKNTPVIELPMPDGSTAKFHVWKSSVMEPGLEAKYPEIRTFLGQGIDDPYATVRFDYNPYLWISCTNTFGCKRSQLY